MSKNLSVGDPNKKKGQKYNKEEDLEIIRCVGRFGPLYEKIQQQPIFADRTAKSIADRHKKLKRMMSTRPTQEIATHFLNSQNVPVNAEQTVVQTSGEHLQSVPLISNTDPISLDVDSPNQISLPLPQPQNLTTTKISEECALCQKVAAVLFCSACSDVFCKICAKQLHNSTKKKNHKLKSLFETCDYCLEIAHKYCKQCDSLFCFQCLDSQHQRPRKIGHTEFEDPQWNFPQATVLDVQDYVAQEKLLLEKEVSLWQETQLPLLDSLKPAAENPAHIEQEYQTKNKSEKKRIAEKNLQNDSKKTHTNELLCETLKVITDSIIEGRRQSSELLEILKNS
jgi:hypothetical protein